MPTSPGEEFLIEQNVIRARSKTRRQVIGCLACRWSNPDEQGAYSAGISKCTGVKTGTIIPILQRLEKAQVITPEQEDANPKAGRRPRRTYYKPANTELGAAFATSVEVPSICGFTEPSPPDTVTPSEKSKSSRLSLAIEIIEHSSRQDLELIIAQARYQIGQLDNRP
ncbi:MAG TPA: hypothetical protein VLF43_04575 [Candidatus Saccharimonadales bacterium]|nr:hypothetical protein [Candidatus Saccharimonadales bacterium]